MENKKSVSLMITILFLFSLVIIASYAYFSADVNNTNVAIINTTTPAGIATFTTEKTDANINITASSMQNSQSNNDTAVASGTGQIKATLKSNDGSLVQCSYGIYLKWNTTTYYTKTPAATTKEFTYQFGSTCSVSGSTCPSGFTNPVKAETQIPNIGSGSTLIGNGIITSNNKNTKTVITTDVTFKFYNINNVNQDTHKSKNYSAKIYIDNVIC